MDEAPQKNEAGKFLVLSDKKKKAMSEYLEDMTKYEISLHPTGDSVAFFVEKQMGRIKVKPVPIEMAKATLKALSEQFDDKKRPLEAAIVKIQKEIDTMKDMIAELDENKFSHRIEMINNAIDKFKPHIDRFNELISIIDENKKAKLEQAKAVIMRNHRKDYFEDYDGS